MSVTEVRGSARFSPCGTYRYAPTKTGQPKHPLYVKGDTPLKRWTS